MEQEHSEAIARAARVAVDVARVGAAAIPLFGGSITEIIGVLDDRRVRRADRLRERLVNELQDRIEEVERRLTDERLADLLDDAMERSASTRDESHIDLIARIVASALRGESSPSELERHHLLVRMASELLPAHFQVLVEIGTGRLVNGQMYGQPAMLGREHTTKGLAARFPHLADVMEPIVGDLIAAGLAMHTPPNSADAVGRVLQGVASPPARTTVELTPYGKWVIEQLMSLDRISACVPGAASPEQ